MNSIFRFLDFIFRIEEFFCYYLISLIYKPPPLPDTILKLVTNNTEVFYESNPDINSFNNYLNACISSQNKNAEEKLMEKAGHISSITGLSIKNLRSVLYDNEKIIEARIVNWLQFKNNLFILEVTSEIPVIHYQFIKRLKVLKTKKYYYLLGIGLIASSIT